MTLTSDQIRAFDELRTRLLLLTRLLETTKASLLTSDPLPPWPTIQSDHDHITRNLREVSETLSKHRDLFLSAHAYPLPTFPGRTKEGALGIVMRKKLDPRGEDWVAEYAGVGAGAGASQGEANGISVEEKDEDGGKTMSADEARELWGWAAQTNSEILQGMLEDGFFSGDYTVAEREMGVASVVTGLRRKLEDGKEGEDEEEDSDDDGESKMVGVVRNGKTSSQDTTAAHGTEANLPPLKLETLLRFMTTGQLPPQP